MFASLRTRLLISYLFVIGLMLCIFSITLIVLLARSPLINLPAFEALRAIAHETLLQIDLRSDSIDSHLTAVAATNNVRILRVGEGGQVLFDSAGQIASGSTIDLRSVRRTEQSFEQFGSYRDPEGRLWLFVSLNVPRLRRNIGQIIFARPRTRPRLVELFGDNALGPLLRAGLIGLIVSVILAIAISVSVARPLRRAAQAAQAIAAGDYSQRAPEEGPREVRELVHAFNDMAERVQRTQQTQRDFLANISHELKTPLTSIQGYSQAILDGAASDPTHAAIVIYDEAGRMRRLVEDLLDLARIESGQTRLRRTRVDLGGLLDVVLSNLSLAASERNVALIREVEPLPQVVGDGDRLAQVFTNLLDNAITHTPAGGQVTVRARQKDEGVLVTVTDTGPGIPEGDLKRVFERFYQVDKSRMRGDRKGTGLGLTICKELVVAHGGRIYAESVEGQGATFLVWLPLPRPTDETAHHLPRHR